MTRAFLLSLCLFPALGHADLQRLKYNHPGLTVDLGVGLWAWPLPMDYDGDGDLDLVVNCSDKPSNGVYVFENTSGDTTENPMPVFKPAKRISKGLTNVQISYPDGIPTVTSPGNLYPDFLKTGLEQPVKLPLPDNVHPNKVRANHWHVADFDGDKVNDLLIGVGDWSEYGWDNAYDENGRWMNGPLRGYVYFARNTGTNAQPEYAKPEKIMIGDRPLDTYGSPSQSLVDMDGDGDLDLICGEFLDGFTYFRNIGTRTAPQYEKGRRLRTREGSYLTMALQMITPVVMDWNKDGHPDIICGDEDGRVAFIENTGTIEQNAPVFEKPRYFQQEADELKFGALATPYGFDWDGDGDMDIISGNTAGNIAFFENLSGPNVEFPKWAAPRLLEVGGKPIRILAGPNGSIQGPAEAKWGYTTICAADWDGDQLPDILVNSILGKVVWHKNIGTRSQPILAAPQPIEVEWDGPQPSLAYGWLRPEGKALLTQWRTTPNAIDWNKDGLIDLVMLDHEGYLALFERAERNGQRVLLPPQRVFLAEKRQAPQSAPKYFQAASGEPIRMNNKTAGGSGRRKISITDWDGDGQLDLLVNATSASFVKQTSTAAGKWYFKDTGLISPQNIEGHDVSPTVVDFNGDGIPDFVGGAEDGYFYYLRNPRTN